MPNFFGQITSMFKNAIRGEDSGMREIVKDNPKFDEFRKLSDEEDQAIEQSVIEKYFERQKGGEEVGGFLGDSISRSYTEFVYGAISTSKPARLANYRKMANFPEIGDAIDEICDSSINYDEKNRIVKLDIRNKSLGDVKSKELEDQFDNFISLFDLDHNFFDYVRTFVIDGQLAWENIIDKDRSEEGVIGVNMIPNESYDFLVDQHGRKKGIVVKDKLWNVGLAGVGVSMQGGMKVQDMSDYFREREQKTRQSQDNMGDNKVEASEDEGIYLPFEQITYVDSGIYSANKLIVFPVLEKARKAFRQLSLIEDAIIIYRLVRAPERLVFNVDTGELPRAKAEQEVHNLMRRFQVKRFYNPETGSVSNDYDPHSILECLDLQTSIPLLDGRIVTLETLISEYSAGKTNWAYSCDPVTGKFVPGKISWAGVTRKNAERMRLTFDNGESVVVTPDHNFPVWSKGKVQAKDLVLNDSLIAFNLKNRRVGGKEKYLQVYDHEKNNFIDVHTETAGYSTCLELVEGVLPRNERNASPESKNKRLTSIPSKMKYDHELFLHFVDLTASSPSMDSKTVLGLANESSSPFKRRFDVLNAGTRFKGVVGYRHINEMLRSNGFKDWRHFKTNARYHNHRVVKIEWLDERADTGTITIDQNHEYHDFHTFALDCGVYTYNSYWFPKPANSSGTSVTTTGGAVQWTQLPDLEYFQKKLFTSLKVPNRRFSDPTVNVEKSNAISYQEYRFAKFIMRNLERFSIGLEKSFRAHLKLTGHWDRFEMSERDIGIEFTPPSSYDLYEQQKLIEIKYKNYDIIVKEHPEISKTIAMRQVLGMSDEEIRSNNEAVEQENLRDAMIKKKVANIGATGNPILAVPESSGGAPGGGGGPK